MLTDEDSPPAPTFECSYFLAQRAAARHSGVAASDNNHALRALCSQVGHVLNFAFRRAVGAGERDEQAFRVCGLDDARGDTREVGAGDVMNDQPDHVRSAPCHRLGLCVRGVLEYRRRSEDAFLKLLANLAYTAVERPGRSRRRNTGVAGDVIEGDQTATLNFHNDSFGSRCRTPVSSALIPMAKPRRTPIMHHKTTYLTPFLELSAAQTRLRSSPDRLTCAVLGAGIGPVSIL